MSGYKVFQCNAMDYHLEPARYESIEMTKLMARYELRMYCDWVGRLQTGLDSAGAQDNDLMDVENLRSALCNDSDGFYRAGAGATTSVDSSTTVEEIGAQWADLIDVILRQTAWSAVGTNTSLGAAPDNRRNVSQAKVDAEMAYTASVQDADKAGVAAGTTEQGRKVLGLKAVSGQTAYDAEKLGDLINNSNMYEIVEKMRAHGCFIFSEDAAKCLVNPKVQEARGGASDSADNATLLDQDDELVFPVNLMSVIGHTASGADENILADSGLTLEINICFKQNVHSGDSVPGHHSDVTGSGTYAGTGPNNDANSNNVA